jgi:DNA polymerase III alpha subunit
MTNKKPALANVNQASIEELVAIKGIGDSLAKRIIDARPFNTLSDLVSVQGINEIKLATLIPFLTLETPKPQKSHREELAPTTKSTLEKPVTRLGDTEAFVFLEDKNDRQDAFIIILAGFIFGLMILFLRRSRN